MFNKQDIYDLSTAFLKRISKLEGFDITQLSKKDGRKILLLCVPSSKGYTAKQIGNKLEEFIICCTLEIMKREGLLVENSRRQFKMTKKEINKGERLCS